MGTCLFKNAVKAGVGNSWYDLYESPVGNSTLVLQLNGSVVGASNLIGSARLYNSDTEETTYLIKNAPIPTGDTIRLVDQAKIVLQPGDKIQVKCDSPGETIDFVASVIQDISDADPLKSLGTYKRATIKEGGNDWTELYTAPTNGAFFLQINAANISESGVQVSVRLFDSSADEYVSLLDGAQVPVADAIRLIDHAKVVLESGDKIEVRCDTNGETVDFVGSVIEDVNRL